MKELRRLHDIARTTIAHSTQVLSHGARSIVACDIFTKLVRNLSSILALCDLYYAQKNKYLADAASIATLTRKFVETYETFYYLCLEDITDEEFEFRELVYSLHHCVEQATTFKLLGITANGNEEWEMVRISDLHHLERNAVFRNLATETQKQVISGRFAFFRDGKPGLSKRRPRAINDQGIYKLFSNAVHGTSLGVNISRRIKIEHPLNFDKVIELSISVSTQYAALSLRGFLRRRTYIARCLLKSDRAFIKRLSVKAYR